MATLVVVASVLTAPTLINCSSSEEGLQACLNGRLADLGLGTPPAGVADIDEAGQRSTSGNPPARTTVAVVEQPATSGPPAATPMTAEPALSASDGPAPAKSAAPMSAVPDAPAAALPQDRQGEAAGMKPATAAQSAQPAPVHEPVAPQPQVAAVPAEQPQILKEAVATPTAPQMQAVQPQAMTPAIAAETPQPTPAAAPEQSEAVELAEVPQPAATAVPAADEPGFDLLRAEPDGSLVVAGTGKPGSEIELFSNGTPIGKTEVESNGDWVLVPDQPLPPGGTELTLGEAGSDERSAQSFVVVIDPEKQDEPLVVASAPGKASEILQGLDRAVSATTETAAAVPPPSSAAPAAQESSAAAQQPAASPMQPAQPRTEPGRQAVALAAEPAAPQKTPAGANAMPAPEASAEAATESDPAVQAGSASSEQTVIANVEPAPEIVAPATEAAPLVPVSIDAVEIDGDRNFFAGAGPEGATVRLYVDDRHVGDAVVNDGRWLIEAPNVLTKPSQRVRVDVLAPGSAQVQSRAEVNFVIDTPAGMELPTAVGEATQPQSAPATANELPVPDAEAVAAAPAPAPAGEARNAAEPSLAEGSPAAPVTESVAPADIATASPSPSTAEAPVESAEAATSQPSAAGAPAQPPARPVGESATATARPAQLPETPAGAIEPQTAAQPVPSETSPDRDIPTFVAVQVGDPEAARFAFGKAIIRRGDNLWTIAKRVYGRGMRYTMIWEANTAQIRDPDWIYPGQVFDLPRGEVEE